MKIKQSLSYLTTTLILLSCSQMRASEKKQTTKSTPKEQTEISHLDEELIRKKGAENHELADANADDNDIQVKTGEKEIDKELDSQNAQESIPYRTSFLLKKNTKRMQYWIEYFTKSERERFQRFINNGEEYRHHIEKILAKYNLPPELYYVGLIESGYYLGARSHASAVGPWQFIRGTGTRYGLKITSEIDERNDLFKSTNAAAMYFKDLHNVFSSWELALSAYNAGEYGIIRRIMKYGTRDFYELSRNKQLPSETINYVPKVLAAQHIIENAQKYGFIIPKKQKKFFDHTHLKLVPRNSSLSSIAKTYKTSPSILRKLNPELKKNSTPRYISGLYSLRVPGKGKVFEENVIADSIMASRSIPREKKNEISINKPDIHITKKGDTIMSLSRKYQISPKTIASINGLKSWKQNLKIGQKIRITKSKNNFIATKTISLKNFRKPIVYKVKRGDNLTELAEIFDLELSKLKKVNNIKRERISVGQKLILPNTNHGIHVVRRGEHLSMLARKFNHPVEAIVKLNDLKKKKIYPGQKIIVNKD